MMYPVWDTPYAAQGGVYYTVTENRQMHGKISPGSVCAMRAAYKHANKILVAIKKVNTSTLTLS